MSYNQELFDRQVEHMLSTKRYQEATRLLLEKAGVRHRGVLSRLFKKQEKLVVDEAVTKEVQRYGQELLSVGKNSVGDYIGAEVDFQVNSIKRSSKDWAFVSSPNRGELNRLITGSPLKLFYESKTYGTMDTLFSDVASNELTRLNRKIRQGIVDGKTPDAIIADLVSTAKLSENQAKTIVNTNFSQAESLVKEKVLAENSHLLKGLVFTAILDSKTSTICSRYDGLVQSAEKVTVRPPLHWNCRSSLVPMLKSKQELLESTSGLINKEALVDVPDGLLTGLAPAKEDFGTWLRRQPMETKLKHLGSEEKVALLEKGSLSLADFFSGKGNPISLAALRVRDNLLSFFDSAEKRAVLGLAEVKRPYQLVRSTKHQKTLSDIFVNDSTNAAQAISLVDYRGTTLGGKRGVRRATTNEFDPRNQTFDPFTGEVKSTYYYDPDFTLYRERVDYMKESKLLDKNQKDAIEAVAEGLEDRLSVNQRTAVVENLRVVFERYAKDPVPWDDFLATVRAEMNYSVINTSRLLDRRSRARSELFLGFKGDPNEPSLMISGKIVPIAELQRDKLQYERYVKTWMDIEGKALARKMYYTANAPWKTYFFNPNKKPSGLAQQLQDSILKRSIRKLFYSDDPIGFYTRYGKTPDKWSKILKKYIGKQFEPSWLKAAKELSKEGVVDFITRTVKERYRSIVDLEFFYARKAQKFADKLVSGELAVYEGQAVSVLASMMEVIAEGITTDYDTLAINLGRQLKNKWGSNMPLFGGSLQDFHREGSQVLEYLREQGMLRINARGVTRRATVDLDTGRSGGNWKDTVSREVEIIDSKMLQLQDYRRRIELSNRLGVDRPENKYYVVPGKKTYVDARGNDTGISIITRSASANFELDTVDGDISDMLNHTMGFQYEVDPEFVSFMDDLVRFKDSRGRAAYYDDLNLFREEIVRRGDQGYGLMEAIRYYNATGRKFSAHARIDGRGRVYYNGYLTPTGGEVVRPFLNSAKATAMTPEGLEQIRIQMAAVIGPGTEALTTAGRLDIFRRHEKSILEVGELLSAKTQRDRRIREFLEHPFIQSIDGEEIAKIARFSLEYYRIYKHTGGDLSSGYNKTIFGEVHSDFKKTQELVEAYNPQVVYHEFWEEPETLAWAKEKGYTLKPFDLSYAQKAKYKTAAEMHLDRERFMAKQLAAADNNVRNAFVAGSDHVFDKKSYLAAQNYRKVSSSGKIYEKQGDKLSTYKSKLTGEADASASGLQVIALSTGNRGAALTSNVLPTTRKMRIYDLVAQDTIADPRFQALMDDLGLNLTWEDLSKASKYQVD